MIIANTSRITLDLFLRYTTRFLWGLCVFVALSFLVFYSKSFQKEKLSEGNVTAGVSLRNKNYSLIGSGSLALNQELFSGYLSILSHQISLLASNSRPDAQQEESGLLMTLKGSQEEKHIRSGEKIYLQGLIEKNSFEPVRFANGVTPLWIIPTQVDRTSTLIEIGVLEENHEESRAQFVLDSSFKVSPDLLGKKCFQMLSSAKWWGVDTLFSQYGGKEYSDFRNKQKIELFAADPYFLFFSEGDYLQWIEGEWKRIELKDSQSELPLAYIKEVHFNQMEIEAWDVGGGEPLQIKISLEPTSNLTYRLESLPTSFRVRSSTQVTCLFGKRRVILKQGDWLLKTDTGWHVLKNLNEIEACLDHKIKGELFIFDSLQKESGSVALIGNLFNDMRTQCQPVNIPIIKDKKSKSSNLKKKHVLSKRDFVSSPSQTTKKSMGPGLE